MTAERAQGIAGMNDAQALRPSQTSHEGS